MKVTHRTKVRNVMGFALKKIKVLLSSISLTLNGVTFIRYQPMTTEPVRCTGIQNRRNALCYESKFYSSG